MSRHSRIVEWTTTISTQLSTVSTPQATGLARWSLGRVLACSGALTVVVAFLATWWRRSEQDVRPPLREWCDEAEAKRGDQRKAFNPQAWVVPVRQWIMGQWPGTPRALARDDTPLGTRCTVLAISVG